MTVPLLVIVWGLAAIAVITAVGRWCRAHPVPDTTPDLRTPPSAPVR